MKNKTWKWAFICFLIVPIFTACDDDDEYYYVGNGNSWISYGNLEKIDNGTPSKFAIRRDDGNRLIVTEGVHINSDEATEGLRVCAQYNIVKSERDEKSLNGKMNYYVALYRVSDVLTKVPVKESFIQANQTVREDSIGNDPINVTEAWFGGKYLNVEFRIPVKSGSATKHFINLVEDDVVLHNDSIYVNLRHNAYGEKPNGEDNHDTYVWSYGNVCFDLTSLVPEGKTSVAVKLIWTEYNKNASGTITREDSGTFSLSGITKAAKDSGLNWGKSSSATTVSSSICKIE